MGNFGSMIGSLLSNFWASLVKVIGNFDLILGQLLFNSWATLPNSDFFQKVFTALNREEGFSGF